MCRNKEQHVNKAFYIHNKANSFSFKKTFEIRKLKINTVAVQHTFSYLLMEADLSHN